jgi:hypothetical protein
MLLGKKQKHFLKKTQVVLRKTHKYFLRKHRHKAKAYRNYIVYRGDGQ